MKIESSIEAAPELQGERLTLRRARIALVRQLCSALLLSASGLYLFFHADKLVAGSCCLGAIASAASLPVFWRQYRLVKTGVVVTIRPQVALQSMQVHPAAFSFLVSLLTLMVLMMGAVTWIVFPRMAGLGAFKGFLVVFNLILWLITGFLWYRIGARQRKTPVVEPVYEQGEGVWPPAPQVPRSEQPKIPK